MFTQLAFQALVQLHRALEQQKQAATQHDEIDPCGRLPRYRLGVSLELSRHPAIAEIGLQHLVYRGAGIFEQVIVEDNLAHFFQASGTS